MSTQLWQPIESQLSESDNDLQGLRKKNDGRSKATWCTTRIQKSKAAIEETFSYKLNEAERPIKKKKVWKKNEKETDAPDLFTRKVKLLPDQEQRVKLKKLFGASRFVYNRVIQHIKTKSKQINPDETNGINNRPGEGGLDVINEIEEKPQVVNQTNMRKLYVHDSVYKTQDTWMNSVPYDIRDGALQDALQAYKNGQKKFKEEKRPYKLKYRSKKASSESIYICSRALKVNTT